MSAVKSPWHAGEVTVQQRVGERAMADRLAPMIDAVVPPVAQEFLRQQSFVVITGVGRDGRVWTGALTGPPGFVDPVTARSVHVKAAVSSGDPLAPVLAGPALVGLLAIEPSTRRRMRLNGRCRPVADGFMIELDQVVSNCPKYISRRVPHSAEASPPPALQAPVTSGSLNEEQANWLSGTDTFFIGTADGYGNADSSHRGGLPGFVEVLSANRFRFPDYSGNSMYMTLGNLELNPSAGFLFVDWHRGATLQLSGRARVDYGASVAAGAQTARVVEVDIDEVVQAITPALAGWSPPEYSRFDPPVNGATRG